MINYKLVRKGHMFLEQVSNTVEQISAHIGCSSSAEVSRFKTLVQRIATLCPSMTSWPFP